MRLWGRIRNRDAILKSATIELSEKHAADIADLAETMTELCRELDISRPVILSKHQRDINEFGHTHFVSSDFMEHVDFYRFEIEFIEDSKDKVSKKAPNKR